MESARAAALSHFPTLLCSVCTETPPQFQQANAFGTYGSTLRELIHLLKYTHMRSLGRPLGRMLATAMADSLSDISTTMTVVAVPLFRRKRPFNQSALLAMEAVRSLRSSHPHLVLQEAHTLLQRTRATGSQFSLSPTQRRKNVRGAFAIAGDVRGLNIMLVDDVYTTGATADECTRKLLQAGALSVRIVTLARAQRESAVRWQPALTTVPDRSLAAGSLFSPSERPNAVATGAAIPCMPPPKPANKNHQPSGKAQVIRSAGATLLHLPTVTAKLPRTR